MTSSRSTSGPAGNVESSATGLLRRLLPLAPFRRPVPRLLPGGLIGLLRAGAVAAQPEPGTIEFTVTEKSTGKPIPCRVHLKDAAGKPQRADKLPFWRDHFACPGTVRLELPPGKYSYEIERGPEYRVALGAFTLAAKASEKMTVPLERLVDLSAEAWGSGDVRT